MYRYLYQAVFNDGSVITQFNLDQNHLDVSSLDPTKSLFADVLEKEKTVGLKSFKLIPQFNGGSAYELDMTTGTVNGLSVVQEKEIDAPLRLIYYRKVTRNFTQDLTANVVTYQYFFGWQTTNQKGENVKCQFEVV